MRKSYTVRYLKSNVKKIQIVVRNSLDLDPEQDPDSDFWLYPDPDSMNMYPKHWLYIVSSLPVGSSGKGKCRKYRLFVRYTLQL